MHLHDCHVLRILTQSLNKRCADCLVSVLSALEKACAGEIERRAREIF